MKENNKSYVPLIVVVAVLVVGYVLWLSYANKKVREVVDASMERIEQRLETDGNEATVTYDDVKVHGMSLRPSASVYKMHVKIEDKRRAREMHIMIPEVVYTPQTFDMQSYRLEVLDSVSVVSNRRGRKEENVIVDFNRSPALNVEQHKDGTIAYNMYVPQNISLSDASEVNAENTQKTEITFASDPVVQWSETAQGIGLDQKFELPQTIVTYAGGQIAALDSLTATTNHSKIDAGQIRYDTQMKLENLTFAHKDLQVLNPISLVNDVSYTGPAMLSAEQSAMQPMYAEIKNVAWMTGLMSLFANGSISYVPTEEKLPYGELTLRIDDVDSFLNYVSEQRPNAAEYMVKVRDALEKLSGATIEPEGEVLIKLAREPQGRLQVGALTLEEALGLFIEMAMKLPDLSAPDEESVTEEEALDGDMDAIVEEEAPAIATEEKAPAEKNTPAAQEPSASSNQKAAPVTPVNEEEVDVEIRTNTNDINVDVVTPETQESDSNAAEQQPAVEDVEMEENAVVPAE
jgi:hypothetical protein